MSRLSMKNRTRSHVDVAVAAGLGLLIGSLQPLAPTVARGEQAVPAPSATETDELRKSDDLYRSAQLAFQRQDYDKALALFQQYLEWGRSHAHRRERVFWSLDRIGAIYLRFQRRADLAIAFFERIRTDERLNDVEKDTLEEWLEVARAWKDVGPATISDAKLLFERGKKYYDSGRAKRSSPMGFATNADYNIAAGYLVPFIVHHDKDPRVGEALLMMGIIRRQSHADLEYWSDNFYLKEVIRRFPHSEIALKAWTELRSEVISAHSDAGKKTLPASQEEMLEVFHDLADPASPASDPIETP